MVEVAKGRSPSWRVCAERAGVVSLNLQGVVCSGVIGEGSEGVDIFGMATVVLGAFAEEANVGGRGAEYGVPGGGGETHLMGGGGDEVHVPEEPSLVALSE